MIVINKNLAITIETHDASMLYHRQCYNKPGQGQIADKYWFDRWFKLTSLLKDPLVCFSCKRYHVSVEDAKKVKFIMESL